MKEKKKHPHKAKQADSKREPVAAVSPLTGGKNMKWIYAVVVLIITFIAFSPALKNNFTNWDDPLYVIDNPHLEKPLGDGVKYFFSNFYAINYHPLTMVVLAVEYKFTQLNPALYHEVSVILHLLNTLLVFWFIFLLSGKKIEAAGLVALFFGIHPMHVESVAWIAELKDVLYAFFFLAAMITYYKYTATGGGRKRLFLFFTFLLFVLSGLSKPAAITFPFAILLIDFYIKRKPDVFLWLEKIPFMLVSALLAYLTYKAQVDTAIGDLDKYTVLQRSMLGFYAMLDYLFKLFLPVRLSAFYPLPKLVSGSLPAQYTLAPVVALVLFGLVFYSLKYTRLIAFGFFFFFLNIVLVLQFLPVGLAITADRYSYMPYLGLFFIGAMGFSRVYRKRSAGAVSSQNFAVVLVLALAAVSVFLTYQRCGVWQNCDTLWTDVINRFPEDAKGYRDRGGYFANMSKYDRGREAADDGRALADFNKAIALKKNDAKVYYVRGNLLHKKKDYTGALSDYNRAIALDSSAAEFYQHRALSYYFLNQNENALLDFDRYVKKGGDGKEILRERAHANLAGGHYEEALKDYNQLIALLPDGASFYYFRGDAFQFLHRLPEAIADYSTAVQKNSRYAEAFYHRSRAYYEAKDFQQASADALKAQSLGYPVDANYLAVLQHFMK